MSAPDFRLQITTRQIMGMAFPIAMAMLVPQINFITNNIFLSGLGQQELASAGITGVFYLIFAVVGNGLSNGLQALIARRAGQNLPQEIGRLFYNGVWISLAFSALGILVSYTLAPLVLHAAIHQTAIAEQAIEFLYIRIWGLPFLYLYAMRNALLVGTNQTRFLIWGTLAEASANVFFDYGLIYGHFGMPALGFNGAAYASIIAEATGLVVIYLVIRIKNIHRQFSFFGYKRLEFSVLKLIFVQSAPLILQYAISIASWEFFYILIEHHGERALAISNTMRNVFGLFGVFVWAFASTASTMVSNVIGQGRKDEVHTLINRIVLISACIASGFFIVINLWPAWFLSFYGQGESFIADGIPVIRIVSGALVLMSFGTIWLNAVVGTGNSVVNLTIETITIVIYCIYIYVVLEVLQLPITWGWASEWVYWTSMFVMAYAYMKSGRWRNKVI